MIVRVWQLWSSQCDYVRSPFLSGIAQYNWSMSHLRLMRLLTWTPTSFNTSGPSLSRVRFSSNENLVLSKEKIDEATAEVFESIKGMTIIHAHAAKKLWVNHQRKTSSEEWKWNKRLSFYVNDLECSMWKYSTWNI